MAEPQVHRRRGQGVKGQDDNNNNNQGDIFESEKTPTNIHVKRPPLFKYPKLPFFEMTIYWLATSGIFLYAFYAIYSVSQTYHFAPSFRHWVFGEAEDFGPFPMRKKDHSDYEWEEWVPIFLQLLPFYALHSILFNIGSYFLEESLGEAWRIVMTSYWIGVCCLVFEPTTVAWSIFQAFTLYLITRLYPRRYTVWGVGGLWLYLAFHYPTFFFGNSDLFLVLILVSYKLLSYISYCTEFSQGNVRKLDKDSFVLGFFRMLYYAFYMPYTVSLIVCHHDFETQMATRSQRKRSWSWILFKMVRLVFWFFFIELSLRYMYFGAILDDIVFLRTIPLDQLVSFGYSAGMFFHLKYVIIFGGPALFASIDNMVPEDGPMCVNRVALYARTWRAFDRGLYKFFKEYIYLPIARPTFSIPRKITGILVSFSFVLLWHGFTHQYLVWISLNICEIFIEQFGKGIYSIPSVKGTREKYLSDTNFRRILAWLQVLPFAFALYSNFYFLAGSPTGWVFADRIFWGETVTMNMPAIILITIGYFYIQSCMEADRLLDNYAEKSGKQCPVLANGKNSKSKIK